MSDTVDLKSDEIFILASGLVCCSVCAPKTLDLDQVQDWVNQNNPTGISSRWKKSDDEKFATGELNGCDCDQLPETRRHFSLNC